MFPIENCRRTRVVVNRSQLKRNASIFKASLPSGIQLMAVVKANAYGHGLLEASKAFLEGGADCLGVAIAEEGRSLRLAGIKCPIHILGPINQEGYQTAAAFHLIVPIHCRENINMAVKAASLTEQRLSVHLVADTGMSRIGFQDLDDWKQAIEAILAQPCLQLIGAYSHFASADSPNRAFTVQQFEHFSAFRQHLPPFATCCHISASSAALAFPHFSLNMVRVGIALYGYPPVTTSLNLHPALSFLSEVSALRYAKAGVSIGYGQTYEVKQPMHIATVACGYGDGYPRSLSNKGHVIINDVLCPIVGRICMDQLMVDVSRVKDIAIGDEVVFIGSSKNQVISAEDVALLADTISYEVLLSPSERVPKFYVDEE